MKINHRISFSEDSLLFKKLCLLNVPLERGDISVLNITEGHDQWPKVEQLIKEHAPTTHFIKNIFTTRELKESEWLCLFSKGHHGYPQPEEDFGYLSTTYDLSNHCLRCGIGAQQKAPFRLRSESKAKKSHFLQLNWVFDEFFVQNEVKAYLQNSKISGITFAEPYLQKKNQPCEALVQMQSETTLAPGLLDEGLQKITCRANNEESWVSPNIPSDHPYCGDIKYHHQKKGPFRFNRNIFTSAPDLIKSHEWFGSGARASRLIIVSQKFREIASSQKWRGVYFEPIEIIEKNA